MRVQTGPAGSTKLYMARGILLRLVNSPMIRYFCHKSAALKVKSDYKAVAMNPMLYHVNNHISEWARNSSKLERDPSIVLTDIRTYGPV